MTIASVPIASLPAGSVLRVYLKDPWMAVPRSAVDGVVWLDLKRPRNHRGIFREQFYCIIEANLVGLRTLQLRVPDFRSMGVPGQQPLYYRFALGYDFIDRAQVFTPPTAMLPDVVVASLVGDRVSKGSAPKLDVLPHFACAPIDLT